MNCIGKNVLVYRPKRVGNNKTFLGNMLWKNKIKYALCVKYFFFPNSDSFPHN